MLDESGKPFYLQFKDKWNNDKTFYFAYGSNISEKRMIDRKITIHDSKCAVLKDYKLVFNKMSQKDNTVGFANIIKSEGDVVEGILYQINTSDIKKLDRFEGFPTNYKKDLFKIDDVYATVYYANNDMVREGLKPTKEYLNYLLEGKDLLSKEYYDKLLLTETKEN